MYRIWFERALPDAYAPLLEGVAIAVGSASVTPDDPLRPFQEKRPTGVE